MSELPLYSRLNFWENLPSSAPLQGLHPKNIPPSAEQVLHSIQTQIFTTADGQREVVNKLLKEAGIHTGTMGIDNMTRTFDFIDEVDNPNIGI